MMPRGVFLALAMASASRWLMGIPSAVPIRPATEPVAPEDAPEKGQPRHRSRRGVKRAEARDSAFPTLPAGFRRADMRSDKYLHRAARERRRAEWAANNPDLPYPYAHVSEAREPKSRPKRSKGRQS